MKKTVVCQLALGQTRVSGYTLYDHDSMAFEEHTPSETKRLIQTGGVNGLMLDENGSIQLDKDGFHCRNLMVKSGVGNYRLMYSTGKLGGGNLFAVTKIADTDSGRVYEIVSNLCARVPVREQKIRALCQLGSISGCWVDADTEELCFAEGIERIGLLPDNDGFKWDDPGDWLKNPGTGDSDKQANGKEPPPLPEDVLEECFGPEDMTAVVLPTSVFEELSSLSVPAAAASEQDADTAGGESADTCPKPELTEKESDSSEDKPATIKPATKASKSKKK